MRLGEHIHELWLLRRGVAVGFVLALLVAVSSVARISVFPPGLSSRSLEFATASTQVVVDTPKSAVYDLRQDTYDFDALTNRTILLADVMASLPVRQYIAREANLPADIIEVTTPLTPDQPELVAEPGTERHATDIVASSDQYRLKLQANPPVPVLDVFAQAPTAEAAENLANAAVDGLRAYVRDVAADQGTAERRQVELRQLGRAQGEVINEGVGLQLAALSFVFVFSLSCAAVLFFARVRRGWTHGAPAAPSAAG